MCGAIAGTFAVTSRISVPTTGIGALTGASCDAIAPRETRRMYGRTAGICATIASPSGAMSAISVVIDAIGERITKIWIMTGVSVAAITRTDALVL